MKCRNCDSHLTSKTLSLGEQYLSGEYEFGNKEIVSFDPHLIKKWIGSLNII